MCFIYFPETGFQVNAYVSCRSPTKVPLSNDRKVHKGYLSGFHVKAELFILLTADSYYDSLFFQYILYLIRASLALLTSRLLENIVMVLILTPTCMTYG
jgi:hypothetical protein